MITTSHHHYTSHHHCTSLWEKCREALTSLLSLLHLSHHQVNTITIHHYFDNVTTTPLNQSSPLHHWYYDHCTSKPPLLPTLSPLVHNITTALMFSPPPERHLYITIAPTLSAFSTTAIWPLPHTNTITSALKTSPLPLWSMFPITTTLSPRHLYPRRRPRNIPNRPSW